MHPSGLSQFAALVALGHGAAFAFDLEEWSFGVVTGGSSVSFDARFACDGFFISGVEGRRGGGMRELPCKLLVVNEHLLGSQRERGGRIAAENQTMTTPSAAGGEGVWGRYEETVQARCCGEIGEGE
jgi:hypothetical protein